MKKSLLFLAIIVLIAAFLRMYRLGENPPSLYWDEASLGYNAYAILTTGHDEHGEFLPLARFTAFGDYKPPGYIYTTAISMAVFGVNEFAIRFPSAAAGILMVVGAYILVLLLTKDKLFGLIAAFLLAVSPWSLQLSRAAFEAHLAALFNLVGVILFYLAAKTKRAYVLPLSILAFSAAFYTFNSNRIITPLLLVFLTILFFRDVWKQKVWLGIAIVLGVLCVLPSVSYLQSRESRLRFHEVSIFTSLDTVKLANERIERSGNTPLSRILHNRRVYFIRDFITHFVDHFKGEYLFISGDENPRLSTQDSGELYLFEFPFLVIGGFIFLKYAKDKDRGALMILGWMLIALIPAATARETPHMLRTASVLPTMQILSAAGIVCIYRKMKSQRNKIGFLLIMSSLFLSQFVYYQHNYWVHYPSDWAQAWQYGYKQMVAAVNKYEKDYDRVIVTENYGRPYIYFLLYNRVSPLVYVQERDAERDWYGLWNVYGFGKYDFVGKPPGPGEKILQVGTPGTFSDTTKILETIKNPKGEVVFEIGERQ